MRSPARLALLLAVVTATIGSDIRAQTTPAGMQPGEAYVTRFSGTKEVPRQGGSAATTVIDTAGTVGSIIDIRQSGQPPQGQHWMDEPQRAPVTAGEVGQVFGVALDDATPPNIYISATSAFGLHRDLANAGWMPGSPNGAPDANSVCRELFLPDVFLRQEDIRRSGPSQPVATIAFPKCGEQNITLVAERGDVRRSRRKREAVG